MNPTVRFEDLPDMIKVKQLAEFLEVGKNLTYRLIRENKIPAVRLGKNIRVPKARLKSYLEGKTGSSNIIELAEVKALKK